MHRKRACATCSAELVAAVPVDDTAGMGQDCSCCSSALLLHCGRPGGGRRTVWRGEVQVQPNLPELKPIRRGCGCGNRFRDFAVARARSDVECEVGPPGVRHSIAVVGECVGGFLIEAEEDEGRDLGTRVVGLDQRGLIEIEGRADESGDTGIVDPGKGGERGGEWIEVAEEEDAGTGERSA